tara:strand:- start:395 stop:934 length:540 start_codon:yes stop_codon:yes gene_type:complete
MIRNSDIVRDLSNRDELISTFIDSLDTGRYWIPGMMWQSFDEQYGEDPDYKWWASGKQMTINAFDNQPSHPAVALRHELEFRIQTNSHWNLPMLGFSNHQYGNAVQHENAYRYALPPPNSLLNSDNEFNFLLYDLPTYVKLINLNGYWINSIYFTLNPNEGWPNQKLKSKILNYPGGIK